MNSFTKRQALLLVVILFFSNNIKAQCRLDKTQWKLVFNEQFNEANTSDLFKKNQSDLDPVNNSNPNCWMNGENNQCPYMSTCNGKTDLEFTPDMIAMHPDYDFTNEDGLGLAYFNASKNTSNSPMLNCWDGSAPPSDFSNYWLGSEISSTHGDFPMLNTGPGYRPGYVYGMFEIRCKLPRTQYSYSAFWLSGNTWPPEIDAFESAKEDQTDGNGNWIPPVENAFFSSIHWRDQYNNPQDESNFYRYQALNTYDLYSDFHTWTIVWTPTEVTWFLDGKELKIDNDMTHVPHPSNDPSNITDGDCQGFFAWQQMHIIIGQGLGCPWDNGRNYFDPLVVDYIKVYRPQDYIAYDPGTSSYLQYYNNQVQLYTNTPYKHSPDWVSNVIQTDQFMPVSISNSLLGLQGGGAYMYKGTNGQLDYTYWDNGVFYSACSNWGYPAPDDNSLALSDNGYMTFYINNGHIYKVEGNTNTIVPNISNAVKVIPNNDPDIFMYLTANNQLIYYNNGSMSVIATHVLGNISPNPKNWNDVFYIGIDNNLWETNTNGSGMAQITGSGDVAGSLAVAPSVMSPAGDHTLQVFYRDFSQKLKYSYYDCNNNYTWHTDMDFVAHMWNNTQATTINNVSKNNILISPDYANPQIYYVGTDERPWEVLYNGTEWIAQPIDPDLPNVAGDFTLLTYQEDPNVPNHIVYRDYNGLIRTLAYTNCDIYNIESNSPSNYILERASTHYDSSLVKTHEQQNMNYANQTLENISAYPNPTKDITYINYNKPTGVYKIIVSSIDGKSDEIPLIISNANQFKIDLQNHPAGIYIATIYTNEGTKSVKLVKN